MSKKIKIQTTTFQVKNSDAVFKWNIVKFLDYVEHEVFELKSKAISIENVDCKFFLSLSFENSTVKDNEQVEIAFQIFTNDPSAYKSAQVCVLLKSKDNLTETIWNTFLPLNKKSIVLKKKVSYIKEWKKFLNNGCLSLTTTVSLKDVKILDIIEEIKREDSADIN